MDSSAQYEFEDDDAEVDYDEGEPVINDDGSMAYVDQMKRLFCLTASHLNTALASGWNVDQQFGITGTALHFMAMMGDEENVSILLNGNANPNVVNHIHGCTPLHNAAKQRLDCYISVKYASAIDQLITAGADISAVDKDGWNAKDYLNDAVRNHDDDVYDEVQFGFHKQDPALVLEAYDRSVAARQAREINQAVSEHLQSSTKPFVQEPNVAQTMRNDLAGPVNTAVQHEEPHRQTRKM